MLGDTPLVNVVASTADGHADRYVNLDNAATTAVAVPVWQALSEFATIYGSVHRGAGSKSQLSTSLYEGCLETIRTFVGAQSDDVVVLESNSTTAINRLAMALRLKRDDVVLISETEHSSNDLPWRRFADVRVIPTGSAGVLQADTVDQYLRKCRRRPRLLAVTGASNVTGLITPIYDIARVAHRYGAEIAVDAAQLAAHRRISIRRADEAEDIDYIALSGHKMYAPFGVGVVIGRRKAFDRVPPDRPGGGTVLMINRRRVIWAPLDSRLNPGTPNVFGVVALAAAMTMLSHISPQVIQEHEQTLLHFGRARLAGISGVRLHGHPENGYLDQLPVFPFDVDGMPHADVAAALAKYNVAVRSGHLCQYEYMRRELHISRREQGEVEAALGRGDLSQMYGMVRASCGLSSTTNDLECLAQGLTSIVRGDSVGSHQVPSSYIQTARAIEQRVRLSDGVSV